MHSWQPDWQEVYVSDRIMLLKTAVNVNQKKHDELLEKAKARKPPKLKLNINALESDCLVSRHHFELCKPYIQRCAVYSSESKKVIIEAQKIDREQFSVQLYAPYAVPAKHITLLIETRKKACLREAVNCYHNNETLMELNSIPFSGKTILISLGGDNGRDQGVLKVELTFSSNLKKEKKLAYEEFCFLYNHLTQNDVFDTKSSIFLRQYACQNDLACKELRLLEWTAFTEYKYNSISNFDEKEINILIELEKKIMETNLNYNEKIIFWKSISRMLPLCLDSLHVVKGQMIANEQLKIALKFLSIVEKLKTSEDFGIFPSVNHGWLRVIEVNIPYTVEEILTTSATKHFNNLVEDRVLVSNDAEEKIVYCIKLVQKATNDIERLLSINYHLFMR